MPVYEYYCEPCNGVFELLRPVREAARDQPCPECDGDARRIVSRDFAAFTVRDGWPRKLPDDGSFWHNRQQVSSPIRGESYQGIVHPDLEEPPDAPSFEEIERWEHELGRRRAAEAEVDGVIIDSDFEREKAAFAERLAATRGPDRVEDAKRRLVRKDLADLQRVHRVRARRVK